jgi:hypothetical protein
MRMRRACRCGRRRSDSRPALPSRMAGFGAKSFSVTEPRQLAHGSHNFLSHWAVSDVQFQAARAEPFIHAVWPEVHCDRFFPP